MGGFFIFDIFNQNQQHFMHHTPDVLIRPIHHDDNVIIADIIRKALAEFGADRPGTVYYDESTDHLFELFQQKGAAYRIAENDGKILGGGGIFPSPGLPEGTCELVKMYLSPSARGMGLGGRLINECLRLAKEMGYRQVYLESMPELKKALSVYEKFGFSYLPGPMGNTGHFGCGLWMAKDI
jgi:putative acetyltransferase